MRCDGSRQKFGVILMNKNNYILTIMQRKYLCFKHCADLFLALVLLLLLLIPFAVIALIQKFTDPFEPVFFSQVRYGKNGKLFRIYKFRSMKMTGLEENFSAQTVSGFGRFLRDSSLDELPQLLNVLTGKMSLVGPRPLIPQEDEIHMLRQEMGIYQLRPGITGWAQIHGRDRLKASEKAAYDREYLENVSLSMDLKILMQTVREVLTRK